MLCAIVAPVVCAEQSQATAEACRKLQEGLGRQVRILSGISDAETAHAALVPLSESMQYLRKMKGDTNNAELWRYLDNTPGVKLPIITILEDMMVQLQRLEKAHFYGNEELRRMLGQWLNPGH